MSDSQREETLKYIRKNWEEIHSRLVSSESFREEGVYFVVLRDTCGKYKLIVSSSYQKNREIIESHFPGSRQNAYSSFRKITREDKKFPF